MIKDAKNAMDSLMIRAQKEANFTRYVPEQKEGHYESYFQRANHPTRPLAFWIRYTIFNPINNPDKALGELWAVYFNGESNQHVVSKTEVPMSRCSFAREALDIRIDESVLLPGLLQGYTKGGSNIEWDLRYESGQEPLFIMPLSYYGKRFPKAKALVGVPMAKYSGTIRVNESAEKVLLVSSKEGNLKDLNT